MDMRRNLFSALFMVAVALPPAGMAQEAVERETANPVEMFACSWRPGKGMNDLLRVTESWNSWADQNAPGYSAWILSPYLRTADRPMDVGWIGSWFSSEDMAATMRNWMGERAEGLGADFDNVVDCANSHALMASYPLQPRVSGPPGSGPVWFAKCSLQEGVDMDQAIEAHVRNVAILNGRQSGVQRQDNVNTGVEMSAWVFVPALGAGDLDFDYYSVVYHGTYADLGANFDTYFNSGGMKRAWSNMRDIARCGNPVLYDARRVRLAERN
jgi:hypothetical protein